MVAVSIHCSVSLAWPATVPARCGCCRRRSSPPQCGHRGSWAFAFGGGQKVDGSCVMKLTSPAMPSGTIQGRRRPRTTSMRFEQFEREVFAVKGGGAEGVAARHAHAIDHQQHPVAAQTPDVDAHVTVASGAGGGCRHREARGERLTEVLAGPAGPRAACGFAGCSAQQR